VDHDARSARRRNDRHLALTAPVSDMAGAPELVLDHVQLAAPAGSEAAARRFYGGLLGLTELNKPDAMAGRGGAWFALADGGQLHIGVQEPFSPASKAHPALRAGDEAALRALASRLSAGGAPVRWDEALSGVTRFYTDDPFGNRLELLARGGSRRRRSGAGCSRGR